MLPDSVGSFLEVARQAGQLLARVAHRLFVNASDLGALCQDRVQEGLFLFDLGELARPVPRCLTVGVYRLRVDTQGLACAFVDLVELLNDSVLLQQDGALGSNGLSEGLESLRGVFTRDNSQILRNARQVGGLGRIQFALDETRQGQGRFLGRDAAGFDRLGQFIQARLGIASVAPNDLQGRAQHLGARRGQGRGCDQASGRGAY